MYATSAVFPKISAVSGPTNMNDAPPGAAALGAIAGAGVGFIKRQPPILLSIATGVNCGIAGFVFFGKFFLPSAFSHI